MGRHPLENNKMLRQCIIMMLLCRKVNTGRQYCKLTVKHSPLVSEAYLVLGTECKEHTVPYCYKHTMHYYVVTYHIV
jgi:hypothetical protein